MSADEAQLAKALIQHPADPAGLQSLAVAVLRRGDAWQAVRLFERAFRLHGDRARFDRQLAPLQHPALEQILRRTQDAEVDEAGRQLERLGRFFPMTGDLARVLGAVRLVQSRDEDARRLRVLAGDTAESGFGLALAGLEALARERDFLGTVVIPAFAAEDVIGRALDSIAASIAHYRDQTGNAAAKVHIVVIDDHSPDDTAGAATAWSAAHPEQSLSLIVQSANHGAGWSRNAGVAAAIGPYLWFLDADDYFLERHLLVTATLLDSDPAIPFVRTGMMFDSIDDDVTPAWRAAAEHSYPCNLCVRRECHLATGGFPEEQPFRPAMAEDVGYSRALQTLWNGIHVPDKTVFYSMRDGNVLQRMRVQMTGHTPPGETSDESVEPRYRAAEILMRRRVYALSRRGRSEYANPAMTELGSLLLSSTTPDEEPGALELANLWIGQGRQDRAIPLLRAAITARPDDRRLHLSLAQALTSQGRLWETADVLGASPAGPGLTEAWFALGVAAHGAGQRDAAFKAFGEATALQPGLSATRFNIGALLMEGNDTAAAIPHLEAALASQPTHVNSLHFLARAHRIMGNAGSALPLILRAAELAPDRADIRTEQADALLALGRAADAANAADAAITADPRSYDAHAAAGRALEALGRPLEALAAWDAAIACNAGFGEAFTHRALLLLGRDGPPPPAPKPAGPPDRRLAASRLGLDGRFGNQMLQYGFLRLYADRHGLTLETPPWLGRQLFELDDPLPGPALPQCDESAIDLPGDRIGRYRGHDITGYFCGDPTGWAEDRDRFRALFKLGRRAAPLAEAALSRLDPDKRTIVAIHLRRGDFGWGRFWIAPEAWYLRWLERIWPDLTDPVLYIATDAPECTAAFGSYQPITGDALVRPTPGIEFLQDFHILANADILATSNSSFSGVAALLNARARTTYRPDRGAQSLVSYDPWRTPILQ